MTRVLAGTIASAGCIALPVSLPAQPYPYNFAAFLRVELAKWSKAIARAGVKPD